MSEPEGVAYCFDIWGVHSEHTCSLTLVEHETEKAFSDRVIHECFCGAES